MILMGCAELLDGLAQADLWLADGTFKVVLDVFFQLYSIHFDSGSGVHPAALYCLLTNKTSSTYNRVLAELQRQIPRATPRTILVDFEKAAISDFSGAHRDATVTGCYFHLCLSGIQRDIQRQKALFLQATTGVCHPSARKYRALNDHVARAVAAYGRAEVLVCLRSIA